MRDTRRKAESLLDIIDKLLENTLNCPRKNHKTIVATLPDSDIALLKEISSSGVPLEVKCTERITKQDRLTGEDRAIVF